MDWIKGVLLFSTVALTILAIYQSTKMDKIYGEGYDLGYEDGRLDGRHSLSKPFLRGSDTELEPGC